MNRTIIFGAMLMVAIFATACGTCAEKEWALVWEENFNGSALDGDVWTRVSHGESDWNDMMSLREDLVFVEDGQLVLLGKVGDEDDATPFVRFDRF